MKKYGCFLFIFLILSLPAMASDVTFFGGFQHPGKVTLRGAASTGVGGATQIINNPIDVGVFGIRFSQGKVIGAEHTIAYAPNFIDSNTKVIIYNSNLLIQAPTPVFQPYFTAGLGTFFVRGTGPTDIGTKFQVNYGGGLKVFPLGPIGGRLDVRGYSVPSVQSQTLNAVEVSLGLVIKY